MKICIILGTRPEIIKMAAIIKECQKRHLNFFILHTNQHYSEKLDSIFFKELELPQPRYHLRIRSKSHAEQGGRMLIKIEEILIKEKPNIVLVEGDTNSVLAGALSAVKLHILIGHIEAGLRSYFKTMPEEINRVLTDHCSDLLFTPTIKSRKNLIREGIYSKKIFITGNTIVDAVYYGLKLSNKKSSILYELKLEKKKYFLATIHREENVDNKERIKGIIGGLELVSNNYNMPIIFPVHPRTKKMMKKFKLKIKKEIRLIEPIGFLDFIQLEANARLILTDSGGVQEEACILNVPCVTLRDNTERPETVSIKSNILAGANPTVIFNNTREMLSRKGKWKNPFGNGESGKKIIKILNRYFKIK